MGGSRGGISWRSSRRFTQHSLSCVVFLSLRSYFDLIYDESFIFLFYCLVCISRMCSLLGIVLEKRSVSSKDTFILTYSMMDSDISYLSYCQWIPWKHQNSSSLSHTISPSEGIYCYIDAYHIYMVYLKMGGKSAFNGYYFNCVLIHILCVNSL